MVILTGRSLTLDDMEAILYKGVKVGLSQSCINEIEASRRAVEKIVQDGRTVYGINTGFGKFSDVQIAAADTEELQRNLILSHACGVGGYFSDEISQAMMVLRANALAKGFSGVRLEVVEMLLELINKDVYPCIPSQGSLGASGDLAPLSHLALVLIGEGEVRYRGECMSQGEQIAAVTMEGLQGIIDAFDQAVHVARGYQEQIDVAARMRHLLQGSKLTTKQGEKRVQDAYSLRCIPQVHGAVWQALGYVKDKLLIEMNAATDNPLLFDEGEKVISGGNFHGEPIAFAMDFLCIAMAELGNIAERRVERLVNPQLNDLPPFLSPAPGLQSGAMIMQYVAASLVSENKTLAHPASVDSIPSSANQEDHVSMGTIAARHALQIVENVRRICAIEAICALQAVEYRGIAAMAPATKAFFVEARRVVPTITADRVFAKDIEAMAQWLHHGGKAAAVPS